MNGKVIFFPLKFVQSEEKLKQLHWAQEQLHYSRISFINAIKRESPFQQAIANARLRNMIKDRLRVISRDQIESERELD